MNAKRGDQRSDWHMRWPFAVAYLAIVIAGLVVDWRVGLMVLAWLPVAYLSRALVRRLLSTPPSGNRSG
jgi:hypothetical protein